MKSEMIEILWVPLKYISVLPKINCYKSVSKFSNKSLYFLIGEIERKSTCNNTQKLPDLIFKIMY